VFFFQKDVQEVSVASRKGKVTLLQLQGVPATMIIWCNGLGEMDELRESTEETTHAKVPEWRSEISDDFKQRLTAQLMLSDPDTRLFC
jgi:hypothetical protein